MRLGLMFCAGTAGVSFALAVAMGSGGGPRVNQAPVVASQHRHDPIAIRERHGKNVTSTNWSGYAVTGANGSVTDAKGSWIVPSVNCNATPTGYAAFWVGIDGFSSNTVEQIGTESDCENGSAVYYAWFEYYPHLSYTVNSIEIKSGDVISAEVTAGNKGAFTVTLTDETTKATFTTTAKMPSAKQSSAEWIAEAPSGGGVLALADFSPAYYGKDNTAVDKTCYATVNRASGAIGSFSGGNVFEITMVTKDGLPKAQPSGLSKDNTSFSVAWANPGP